MTDFRMSSRHPDGSVEDRFLHWVDDLVDPATGAPPPPDGDFAEIARTATTIDRAAGTGAATAPSPERTEAMWEDIMNITTATPAIDPQLTGGGDPPPVINLPLAQPSPGWRSFLATAVLIAAIIVAGIATIWQVTDPFGSGDSDMARQPGVAGSATPAAIQEDCPLTRDTLVFNGDVPADADELDLTYGVVEPDGDFVLACNGVDDPIHLMSGVEGVRSLSWPGTVLLIMEDGSAVAYNIATEEQVAISWPEMAFETQVSSQGSPWLLTAANDAVTDWHITNLKTMETMRLSDEIGGVLEEPMRPAARWSRGGDHAIISRDIISIVPSEDIPANDPDADIAEMPERVLVIDETLETRRWIDTWGQMTISNDGEVIAYQTQIDLQPMIRVEDAASGTVLAEITDINFNAPSNALFAFTGDAETLAYLNNDELWLASYEGGSPATRVETGDVRPTRVLPTGIPGHVLTDRASDDANGGSVFGGAAEVSILETSTGAITDIEGLVVDTRYVFFDRSSLNQADHIVTASPANDSPSDIIFNLVDLRSGEIVLSSDPMQGSIDTLEGGRLQVNSGQSGAVVVASIRGDQAIVFDVTTSTVETVATEGLNRLDVPSEGMQWTLTPSSDGEYLYAYAIHQLSGQQPPTSQHLAMAELSNDPTWTLMSDDVWGEESGIARIPAVTEAHTTQDEPAVLEAQEITSLEASPVATPSAGAGACPLTQDVPVFTGTTPETPFIEDFMQLSDDGTLSLHCNGGSNVVAERVRGIRSLTWPGAVLLTMEDGSLRGVNLLAGDTDNFGPESVLTDSVADNPMLVATPGSPWMLLPANRELTDWRIIDQRTMESFLLSDEIGGQLPGSTAARYYALSPDAAVIGFPGRISERSDQQPRYRATPPPGATVSGLPFEDATLVVDGSLDNRRWAEITYQTMTPAAISPDSNLLAVEQTTDDGTSVRVERLRDGEVIAETGIEYGGGDTMVVLNDGGGILHLTDGRLDLVTWDPEPTVETLLEFEPTPQLPLLVPTADPETVLMSAITSTGESEGYLINTTTLDVIELPGLLESPFLPTSNNYGVPPRYVLAASPLEDDEDRATLRLIDVTTGEVIVESDPIELAPSEILMRSATLPQGGNIAVSPSETGPVVVLNALTGEPFEIEAPDDDDAATTDRGWGYFTSYGGTFILAAPIADVDKHMFIRALAPEGEWLEIPSEGLTEVIAGSGALPAATGDPISPERTPTEASPAATPSAEADTCDLTNDMPVFVDTEPDVSFVETYALLDEDGTLTLQCDGTSETVATGVEQVVPTRWPGAIALAMQNGTSQLMNLINGATVQVEAEALLDSLSRFIGGADVYASAPHSPWLISVANAERTDRRITDLRTMESFLLSEEIGGLLPEPRLPVVSNGLTAQRNLANGNEVAVITFMHSDLATPAETDASAGTGSLPTPAGALVLAGSIEARRWIDIPPADARIPMIGASVSADGSLLAYVTTSDTGESLIRIEHTVDGALVAEVPIDTDAEDTSFSNRLLLLAGGEPHLVYSTGTSIEIISWDPEIERATIGPDDGLPRAIASLVPTSDPNTVLVGGSNATIPINIATGTIGEPYQYAPYLPQQLQLDDGDSHITTMVNFDSDSPSDVPATIQIVNPVTGEVLIESDPIDMHPLELSGANAPVSLVRDGTLAVAPINPGRALVLDAATGETWEINRPIDDVEQWLFMPSEDGRLIYAVSPEQYVEGENAPFYMVATTPDAEWVQVGAESIPRYIVGTHDLPSESLATPTTDEAPDVSAREATPTPPEVQEQVTLAPVSTPMGDASTLEPHLGDCDLSQDIPLLIDEDSTPFPDRTMLTLDDGELWLRCVDSGSALIEKDVESVQPATTWPGSILLIMEDGSLQGVNLASGARGDLGPAAQLEMTKVVPSSRWLLMPANGESTDWRVVDLDSMESLLLSDLIGGVLPQPTMARPYALSPDAAVIGVGGTPSGAGSTLGELRGATPSSSATSGTLPFEDYAALIIDGSLSNTRWSESTFPSMNPAAISPDEVLVALEQETEGDHTVRIERLSDGEVVANTGIDYIVSDDMALLDNGAGLLHLTTNRLDLVTWSDTGETTTATVLEFELDEGIPMLEQSADPSTVVVSMPVSFAGPNGYLVDITTVDVIEVPHLFEGLITQGMPPSHVLTAHPIGTDEAHSTIRLIDVTTGETVVESEPLPYAASELATRRASMLQGGTTGVVLIDPTQMVVIDAGIGEAFTVTIDEEVFGISSVRGWYLHTSPNGTWIVAASATEQRALVRQSTSGGEWIEAGAIGFVPGSGGLPEPGESSATPTANEAPDVSAREATPTPPEVQEQVTLAPASTTMGDTSTSAPRLGNCDLTQNIPILTGAEEPPLDGLVMLLADGELWLHCGDSASALIEKGVTDVRSTGWPAAIVLTTEDGSLRGVNLATGATGDFGPETVLTESVASYAPFHITMGAPWLTMPANPEMTDWRLVDLRTMESMLLSDEIGGVLPVSTVSTLFAHTPDAAVIGFPGTPVNVATPQPGTTVRGLPFEHAALVIDGSLENRRWIETSRPMRTTAAISPDGELLAFTEPTETGITVRVERLSNGELVADTGIAFSGADTMLLLNDGLLHLAEDRLDLVTWDGEVTVEPLIDTLPNRQPAYLFQSADPDVGIVRLEAPIGSVSGYLVNAATGDITEVPNLMRAPLVAVSYIDMVPARYVLAVKPHETDDERSTVQLIDVTTGEVAVESDPIDTAPADLAALDAAVRDGGALGMVFLPNDSIIVLDAATGAAHVIEAPSVGDGTIDRAWWFMPSPGSKLLSAVSISERRLFVRELAPQAEWIELPEGSVLNTFPGTSTVPDDAGE